MTRDLSRPACLNGFLILLALVYGAGMLSLGGRLSPHPAASVPYHLLQAQAMLEGRLCLGNSWSDLRPGLAWHNGQVQQVWGLGIALWLLPFQALWRLAGGVWFPCQFALGVAFALLALYAGHTAVRWAQQGKTAFAIGFTWIILLSPPLWTLARGSQLVFEETVLYGVLLGLGILVALIRAVCFDSRRDICLCCVLAALSGLVRPTLLIYGLGGVLVCGAVTFSRSRQLRPWIAGMGLFLCGVATLAWTNQIRFGSPLEFGHRLTVSSQSMIYLTRFGNPYQAAPVIAASKELTGLLFLSPPIQDNSAFAESWFCGQAPAIRWRRLNLSGFDLANLAFIALGLTGAAVRGIQHWRSKQQPPGIPFTMVLPFWSGLAFAALFLFYLHYPSMTSRYLFDFAPALTGFALAVWLLISKWGRGWPMLCLAGWLIYELSASLVIGPGNVAEPTFRLQPGTVLASLNSFNGIYSLSRHPSETGQWFNGAGWEKETGVADDVVILAVDHPQFIELHASPRRHLNGGMASADEYRANLDGQALHLREVKSENDGFKVTFDIPPAYTNLEPPQMIFLCFSSNYTQTDRNSERFLYSVKWK